MKLREIAEIRTGLVLTRKKATIKYEIQANYKLLTLNNIEDNGAFSDEEFEPFSSNEELSKEYFTQEGDVLIRLSAPYTAVCINQDTADLLVPSYFSIIRLKNQNYIPEYITWYLNSDQVKKELTRSQTGTAMSTTNKTVLSSIEIKEIPIETQEKIARIRELHLKELKLLKKLVQEKEKYYKGLTDILITRNKGEE
ncbi:MAG: restriction endonuclease subunit S [Desulfitobacterium sp.]|nr:restriction endonuclease subunit S [Desulfitobacterium sp.]